MTPSLTLPPLDLAEPPPSAWERLIRWGVVIGLHGLLLTAILAVSVQQDIVRLPASLTVRLLPLVDEKKPAPAPLPPAPAKPVHKAPPVPKPQTVLTARASEAPAAFAVAPQAPTPAPAPVAVAAPSAPVVAVAVSAARFDADYLHNPKPVYPALSRRMNEEGRVLLRVLVSPQGGAVEVAIKQSSGFSRLDNAASEAVAKWKFVPAKRGDEAVEAWVVVPVTFSLSQ